MLIRGQVACGPTTLEVRVSTQQLHRMRPQRETEISVVRDQILPRRRSIERDAVRWVVFAIRVCGTPERRGSCHTGNVPVCLIAVPRQIRERAGARETLEVTIRQLCASSEIARIDKRTRLLDPFACDFGQSFDEPQPDSERRL